MILWIASAAINAAAVVMSVELNEFDWLSYVNLFLMAISFYFVGAKS